MFVGQILNLQISKSDIVKKIAVLGIAMVVLGLLWSTIFPINKSLWTSSYVLYTAGLATICLVILYYLIDVVHVKKWTKLFLIWGVNPMVVFFFSGIIPRTLSAIKIGNPIVAEEKISIQKFIFDFTIVPLFNSPLNASLFYAVFYVIFWSIILWILYEYKLFFKV
jgi:predicted acyltransferase